ncbi:sigma associated protein [Virgisporangium aliadipatigenens]|uniref:Sigma associated protein n=1 Tax=Virgisporangium aliadipatigenens TaxID=741659 RepID=A0A8J4DP68_9ACTN|nr:YciI family protein [Virgisporangium aliadipatigenens]GIJ45625.1 sigma associated protein [Virgisporangium aliadipatigenens]
MKYMLLMNSNGNAWGGDAGLPGWSPEDIDRMMGFMEDLNKDLQARGEWIDAQGLTGPQDAKLVRARDGQPVITDGPFAESKEFLAGYWLLKLESDERAVEIATRISVCPGPGGAPLNQEIQIRPIAELP